MGYTSPKLIFCGFVSLIRPQGVSRGIIPKANFTARVNFIEKVLGCTRNLFFRGKYKQGRSLYSLLQLFHYHGVFTCSDTHSHNVLFAMRAERNCLGVAWSQKEEKHEEDIT